MHSIMHLTRSVSGFEKTVIYTLETVPCRVLQWDDCNIRF